MLIILILLATASRQRSDFNGEQQEMVMYSGLQEYAKQEILGKGIFA